MHWRQYLRIRTSNPTFLWRLVIGILVAGAALAFVVQYLPSFAVLDFQDRIQRSLVHQQPEAALESFEEMLADTGIDFEEVLDALPIFTLIRDLQSIQTRQSLGAPLDLQRVEKLLQAAPLDGQQQRIAMSLWQSLAKHAATDELTALAAESPPNRFANYALGVFLQSNEIMGQAAAAFEREARQHPSTQSRERAVELYLSLKDVDSLKRLASDPDFADAIPPRALIQIAIAQRDWPTVWRELPRNEWERYEPGPVLLALFAGICWFSIAAQAGQIRHPRGARLWLCAAAIPLGMLSVWPTLFLGIWQEEVWNFADRGDLFTGLRYYVLSVGLREEFCKLLLLLPLAPLLVKRGNELETLVVSACVGLGFAVEENSAYFAASAGGSTIGRFLTANFFHMAATGLIGLALMRAIWYPREKGLELLAVFGVVVFAHGFYDAAIGVVALQEFSIAASIIYILLAYQFFHELRSMRHQQQETISLTANFLCGVALLASVTLVYLSSRFGFETAARMLVPELLSTGLMAYMFLREMPNSLLRAR